MRKTAANSSGTVETRGARKSSTAVAPITRESVRTRPMWSDIHPDAIRPHPFPTESTPTERAASRGENPAPSAKAARCPITISPAAVPKAYAAHIRRKAPVPTISRGRKSRPPRAAPFPPPRGRGTPLHPDGGGGGVADAPPHPHDDAVADVHPCQRAGVAGEEDPRGEE